MLTIQIVTWNGARVLPETLVVLKDIPPTQATIRFIDNHSTDVTRRLIAAALPGADILALPQNIGFAAAHNLGFAKATTPYVVTCDQDVALSWAGVVELVESFSDEAVAAVQGKLLRAARSADGRPLIDSAGIVRTLALNGVDRGAGLVDSGQYNAPDEVAAVTGGCAIWRLSALRQVAYGESEVFDEDFFAYKEDVDLGWRLRRAGYVLRYEPVLMGIHHRTFGAGSAEARWTSLYRRLQNVRTHYSLRNYIWMLVKNISAKEILIYDIAIAGRLLIFVFLTVLYPPLLMAWLQALQKLPLMVRKRVAQNA